MQFSDVIGQEELKRELPALMQSNRLAHALLFLGKEGSGALPLVLAFVQSLVCERVFGPQVMKTSPIVSTDLFENSLFSNPTTEAPEKSSLPAGVACGTCASCLKMKQLIHPDVHFSYPTIKNDKLSRPAISTDYINQWREFIKSSPYGNVYDWLQFIGIENKQGNITANECNDIISKLNLKSFEGGYKVLIMWMPEFLGAEGNRLLKLIEEPPEKTVFIFVAENDAKVLPTILSRCQIVKVPALKDAAICEALIKRNKIEPEQAAKIAAVSLGNYREAQQMAQDAEEDWQALLRNWLAAITRLGPSAQVKWVEEINKLGREKQKQFIAYFVHLLQLAIRLAVFPNNRNLYPEKEADFAERLNRITDREQQQAIVEELEKAIYYIERNANGKMLFMALTLKFYHIIKDKIVFLND